MRQAKAFFFVCLGILCIVVAYHLGAQSAGAQGAGTVECVGFGASGGVAVVNHHLYLSEDGAPSQLTDYGEIPNPARAIACGSRGVVLEDGTVYENKGAWRQLASLPFSGATAAQGTTWGQLKMTYAK
jgi:hypothetical protein